MNDLFISPGGTSVGKGDTVSGMGAENTGRRAVLLVCTITKRVTAVMRVIKKTVSTLRFTVII